MQKPNEDDIVSAEHESAPAQCRPQSSEAPPRPRATPGDEAEPPKSDHSDDGTTLCPRCAVLAQAKDVMTVTDFSRWLRACGFSRSQATKIAGHGWPKGDDDTADSQFASFIQAMKANADSIRKGKD